ncbi:MAG: hydrogenase maturation protease [Dehalococcoidia bacterium]|nr:hydrogenase maturation protease [Dehalococcoidia bacterium]
MNTIVMGIGNPILTDDGVGIRVAQFIKQEKPHLEIIETCEAGLALLDHMVDCDRLVIIDSIKVAKGKPGELFELEIKDLKPTTDFSMSHGVDLAAAFEVGRGLGFRMPQHVSIYAVNVKDNTNFGEGCTRDIEKKIPFIARQIIRKEKL